MIKSKINITKHTMERWCERILNIQSDEIAYYMNNNRDKLTDDINETILYAEFLYKGQLGKDNITRHYYLHNDIVFITNTDNNAVITVYKVDLGFPADINTTVRKGLIEEVRKLQLQKDEIDFQQLNEVEIKQHEINTIDDQLFILEQQIKQLKDQKKMLESDVKLLGSKSEFVKQELNKYVLMLVNSLEYKKDIQSQ